MGRKKKIFYDTQRGGGYLPLNLFKKTLIKKKKFKQVQVQGLLR